jgi:hypothetical protein
MDTLLQYSAKGGSGSFRDEGQGCERIGVDEEGGMGEILLTVRESLKEFRGPGDGMRTLESMAGEDFMERCLYGSSLM